MSDLHTNSVQEHNIKKNSLKFAKVVDKTQYVRFCIVRINTGKCLVQQNE